jgi:hypothetical protein
MKRITGMLIAKRRIRKLPLAACVLATICFIGLVLTSRFEPISSKYERADGVLPQAGKNMHDEAFLLLLSGLVDPEKVAQVQADWNFLCCWTGDTTSLDMVAFLGEGSAQSWYEPVMFRCPPALSLDIDPF